VPNDRNIAGSGRCIATIRNRLYVWYGVAKGQETTVTFQRHAQLGFCILVFNAVALGGALAQAGKADKPIDLKPLIPPVFSPLPPNSQLNPGTVGDTSTPYTTAPLQDARSPTQPAPGLKLSIPSR
jgi:hypothetical protein